MQSLLILSMPFRLCLLLFIVHLSVPAQATDCSITPATSHCWERSLSITTASLASKGWKVISTSLVEITSDGDSTLNQKAILEISYWQKGKDLMLCRSIIRDDTSRIRMTGSSCFKALKSSERTKR